MRNKILLVLGMTVSAVMLSSCNSMPKEIKAVDIKGETLYMRADGSGQIAYVEDFKENYLNFEELKGYIAAELSSYNKKFGEKAAELSDIELNEGRIKVVLTFKNSKVYTAFNGNKGENNIKFPKAAEALTEFTDAVFEEADSGDNINKKAGDVLSDEYNIAVVEGFVNFQTENKIKYYSGGILLDSHHLRVDEGNKAVVVYSK